MNYQKHYDSLIKRSSKTKPIEGYHEKHRVIPGCMGGKYVTENIVWLTAEEHFVAHQLLYKIYKNPKLLYAINMMTIHNSSKRNNNKRYSWLRKKFSENHPNKSQESKTKLSESMTEYYNSKEYAVKKEENYWKYREKRICKCGCGESFITYKKDKKKYVKSSHATKNYMKTSNTLKKTISNLSEEEKENRLQKSLRACDHEKRGKKISEGKKGKKTNQQKIMGEKYSKMSDEEFEKFLLSKKENVRKRMTNLRNKYKNV
jgi:hypothetical protein